MSLTVAVPRGALFAQTLDLLDALGIDTAEVRANDRKLLFPDAGIVTMRPSDVPTYVEAGAADIGITGKDVLREQSYRDVYELLDLGYGACTMVLATVAGDPDPAAEALRRLITAGWRVLARNLTIARLATEVLPPERMRQAHQAALDPVRRLITRGQGAGEFRADQPVDWMVTVLYTLMHAAAEDVSAGRRDAETAAVLIHGSIRGAFAPR
jgi:ATP phosphoribosyltransferase